MSKSFYRWLALFLFLIEVFIAVAISGDTYPFIRYSIGDLLVVILLYSLVKSFVNFGEGLIALGVLAFAFLIEFAQYFHIVDLLGIKSQVIRTTIGTSFSFEDLIMYSLGTMIAYLADNSLKSLYAKKKV
jgi:hypothetical protein